MINNVKEIVEKVIADVKVKNPGQEEFHQTVEEVFTSLIPVLEKNPAYVDEKICLYNSVIKLWQNLIISLSDFPFGSKSEPPLPPPIGRPCAKYFEGKGIWNIKADVVLPCATQNDINLDDAKKIVENGTFAVGEGANMPCTNEAVEYFLEKGVLLAPAKAANAGGVAHGNTTSALIFHIPFPSKYLAHGLLSTYSFILFLSTSFICCINATSIPSSSTMYPF